MVLYSSTVGENQLIRGLLATAVMVQLEESEVEYFLVQGRLRGSGRVLLRDGRKQGWTRFMFFSEILSHHQTAGCVYFAVTFKPMTLSKKGYS